MRVPHTAERNPPGRHQEEERRKQPWPRLKPLLTSSRHGRNVNASTPRAGQPALWQAQGATAGNPSAERTASRKRALRDIPERWRRRCTSALCRPRSERRKTVLSDRLDDGGGNERLVIVGSQVPPRVEAAWHERPNSAMPVAGLRYTLEDRRG